MSGYFFWYILIGCFVLFGVLQYVDVSFRGRKIDPLAVIAVVFCWPVVLYEEIKEGWDD